MGRDSWLSRSHLSGWCLPGAALRTALRLPRVHPRHGFSPVSPPRPPNHPAADAGM